MKNGHPVPQTTTLHAQYDVIANDYNDSIAIINSFQSKFYKRNLPKTRGSLLDVGCGTGDILAQLAKYFTRSYGIDPMGKFVSLAQQKARHSDIQLGTAERLDFNDETMDCVISHIVFQHVDREQAVKEAVRVLKPGGKLIISEVLAKDAPKRLPVYRFIKQIRFNYYLVIRYGYKKAKRAKMYQKSSDWRKLTAIHRGRRFDSQRLYDFYNKMLPGVTFKQIDSRMISAIWEKPRHR